MHFVQKCILQLFFSFRLVLNLFLIIHQISGSRSYKIVLTQKSVYEKGVTATNIEITDSA